MFKIDCPFCGQRIEVPDELNNTTANCPACNQEVYLTSEDAVDDLDPVVERMRRESAESDRARMDQLRMVAIMQQSEARADRRAKSIVNVLLWIFVWGPLCVIGAVLIVFCLLRVATGHW